MTSADTRLSLYYSTGSPALGHQSGIHGERGNQPPRIGSLLLVVSENPNFLPPPVALGPKFP